MRALFAGGGTGGHLFPGISLAEAIRKERPDAEIIFVGTNDGMETKIVPEYGYKLELVSTGKGSPISVKRPLNALRFIRGLLESKNLISQLKPNVVVALGGYAASAPGLAAKICGCPLVLLEQNTIPGRTNRMLSRWAKKIYSQFSEAEPYFAKNKVEFIFSGSPVRKELEQLRNENLTGDALLVMGGSQGAQSLNHIIIDAVEEINQFFPGGIIHVAGELNKKKVAMMYEEKNIKVEVHGFIKDMASLYRRSTLAVCRSGAGAVAELSLAGIPAIFIPLPSAMDDHQRTNAEAVTNSGGAVVIDQNSTDTEHLVKIISKIASDKGKLKEMSEAIRKFAKPHAAHDIARDIINSFGA